MSYCQFCLVILMAKCKIYNIRLHPLMSLYVDIDKYSNAHEDSWRESYSDGPEQIWVALF